ncbi:translation initiation factor IF-2 [Candidatus Uhrbacteria bacterium]|nr:translation initiation factor IF-2 [Candidatus Uhrbacteria bacterium]
MNITELARKLKVTSVQLYELFPQIGIDVGRRAIKIDDKVAHKILKNWSTYQPLLFKKPDEEKPLADAAPEEKKPVAIPAVITVRDFAVLLNVPVPKLIVTLMNNGILTALNEKIDYDTASIIAEDLGFMPHQLSEGQDEDANITTIDFIKTTLESEDPSTLLPRPPVVVIMGHVDHGKTSLLDAIRTTNVIATESGGITQHIGAYQVEVPPKEELKSRVSETGRGIPRQARDDHSPAGRRMITFIDTPGHEAFTTMRSRGAKIADIAILVVAADDGIKPQTTEAIKIIRAAGLPLIVAVNKMDKPGADSDKVKRELSDHGLIPEDWGGSTICVPISAKQHTGIDDLLEMILLVADMEKEKLVANPGGTTVATVIESHVDKNEGPVATILVQNGTLRMNDFFVVDHILYGKARLMKDHRGTVLSEVLPSQPAKIIGFKKAPRIGDCLTAMTVLDESVGKMSKQKEQMAAGSVVSAPKMSEKDKGIPSVNIILKTDTLGSLEAIATALMKIEHPDVKIKVVSKGLGAITTADILNAEATKSFVAGFHVPLSAQVRDVALEKRIDVKLYKIIYELIDDIKLRVEALLAPLIQRTVVGSGTVLKVFRNDHGSMVVGVRVLEGVFAPGARVHVLRGEDKAGEGRIKTVQLGKIEIKEAISGQECGILYEGKVELAPDDVLQAYTEKKIKQTLD